MKEKIEDMLHSDAIEELKKRLGHETMLIEAVGILYEHGLLSELISECVDILKEEGK